MTRLSRLLVPRKAAGPRPEESHHLRHSFASNVLAACLRVVTVRKALGHGNPYITFTAYQHAIPRL